MHGNGFVKTVIYLEFIESRSDSFSLFLTLSNPIKNVSV